MEQVAFWIVAPFSLGSAIAMIFARNAVHSALLLVVNFFTLAVFYVLLDAQFLAAVQIIVYAGAIMVLFLFVIMLLGVDVEDDLIEHVRGQRPAAYGLFFVLAATLVFSIRTALSTVPFKGLKAANAGGNVQAVGRVLFTRYLWPFELTSLLLLVAAIAALVVGRKPEEIPGGDEEIEPSPEEPAVAAGSVGP